MNILILDEVYDIHELDPLLHHFCTIRLIACLSFDDTTIPYDQ